MLWTISNLHNYCFRDNSVGNSLLLWIFIKYLIYKHRDNEYKVLLSSCLKDNKMSTETKCNNLWYGSNDFITNHIIEKRKRVMGNFPLFSLLLHFQDTVPEIFCVIVYVWVLMNVSRWLSFFCDPLGDILFFALSAGGHI